ncbi:MAG: phospholipid carrier-dependent glycosyltransferase [Candidatus Omnitrophica bacterium]|nr:phospholipid carrier-dependent glycosyltransferase [Candidatus Omnitrophota bacterium]
MILSSTDQAKTSYVRIAVFFAAAFSLLQLADLKADYSSLHWTIQADEKLTIPDARALYIGGDQKISDYTPPVSAGFGIGGPLLNYAGFRLFGLDNTGLRFFFFFFSAGATLFILLSIVHILPSRTGVWLALFQVLNYKYFFQSRLALLENVLIFFLSAAVYCIIARPQAFSRAMRYTAFFAGALIIFKPIYPVYLYFLIAAFMVAERTPLKTIFTIALYGAAGLVIFGALHMAVLARIGLAGAYYTNMLLAWAQLTGHTALAQKMGALWTFQPTGFILIIPLFFNLLVSWYIKDKPYLSNIGYTHIIDSPADVAACICAVLLVILVFCTLIGRKKASRVTITLAVFLLFNLIASATSFFYLKRALPLFPVTFIFICSLMKDASALISDERLRSFLKAFAFYAIILLIAARMMSQSRFFAEENEPLRSVEAGQKARLVERLVKDNGPVYMHAYWFRALWQIKNRIIAGDDQLFNNQAVLDKAIKEGGKYIVLARRGWPYTIPAGHDLKLLMMFKIPCAESGFMDEVALFEIQKAQDLQKKM